MKTLKNIKNTLSPLVGPALALCAMAVVLIAPDAAYAAIDLGATKITEIRDAMKTLAIVVLGIAGMLAGIYIAFGNQDGNQKLGSVIKGCVVVSVIVTLVQSLV
jgi:hypothetical protein